MVILNKAAVNIFVQAFSGCITLGVEFLCRRVRTAFEYTETVFSKVVVPQGSVLGLDSKRGKEINQRHDSLRIMSKHSVLDSGAFI